MNIHPIRTEADLTQALQEIDRLWGAPAGTPEGDTLDVLATLVEAYERAHHPVPESDPVEILQFAIGEMGRSQVELAELLGSRSRASEILNRKRPLNLEQIRKIAEAWSLPIATLAKPYRLERDAA
ncbi:helix-turn-helix domain-containing protein [Methylobacterium sp. B4]|uniref:helix-turn-helix domain-containing protein n=1 Tax=Methylobacterium sp. B4 TaxID=1938755 RepID=UPI000D7523DC|nr:helix-turn-helix domain-containing protein [Methylobacterium sp. B4]PXW65973.1 Xre family transcriptional regulator [Methylobacterium sp. B4]